MMFTDDTDFSSGRMASSATASFGEDLVAVGHRGRLAVDEDGGGEVLAPVHELLRGVDLHEHHRHPGEEGPVLGEP